MPSRPGSKETGAPRLLLTLLGAAALVGGLAACLHAVHDGTPDLGSTLGILGALAADPWATAWLGALGGLLLLLGGAASARLAWTGVAVLATYGLFVFPTVGWPFLGVALLAAALLGRFRHA